jgi:hypothetical protein
MRYLINNYNSIIGKREYYHFFLPDEEIFYYTIYPDWNETVHFDLNQIKPNFEHIPYINIKDKTNTEYIFHLFMKIKPFLYNNVEENNLFTTNYTCYKEWDFSVNEINLFKPELSKYFEFIKTFRYVNF